mmetsp:Transcript_27015/g.81779  ORF Transcript_27015/g.81779 Transcript_27015/m.81779 type:complete len:321 (-) Transcript_27015:483-1445(-)
MRPAAPARAATGVTWPPSQGRRAQTDPRWRNSATCLSTLRRPSLRPAAAAAAGPSAGLTAPTLCRRPPTTGLASLSPRATRPRSSSRVVAQATRSTPSLFGRRPPSAPQAATRALRSTPTRSPRARAHVARAVPMRAPSRCTTASTNSRARRSSMPTILGTAHAARSTARGARSYKSGRFPLCSSSTSSASRLTVGSVRSTLASTFLSPVWTSRATASRPPRARPSMTCVPCPITMAAPPPVIILRSRAMPRRARGTSSMTRVYPPLTPTPSALQGPTCSSTSDAPTQRPALLPLSSARCPPLPLPASRQENRTPTRWDT